MEVTFIQDFAVVLVFAFIISILFSRLKQPVILGYLVAGSLIGPHALNLVGNIETVNLFAEFSIIFIIFYIGLEFNLKKLRRVGGVALFTGILEVLLIIGLGNAAGRVLGLPYVESIFLGGILAISSTAVITKVLSDLGYMRKDFAQIILGILIIEGVAAVVLLTIFGSIAMVSFSSLIYDSFLTVFKIILFFVIALVFGLRFIPRSLNQIGSKYSRETLLITSLALCFALAAFSDYLGFSVALGAFIMGAIISETDYREQIERSVTPIRFLFSAMFFVSIGMLINLMEVTSILPLIIAVSALAIVLKIVCCSLGTYLSGYSGMTAMYVGMGLIPRGEFSFIIAKLGVDSGVISSSLYQVTIGMAIVTTLVVPFAVNSTPSFHFTLNKWTPTRIKNFLVHLSFWIESFHKQFHGDTAIRFKKILGHIAVNCLTIILILIALLGANTYFLNQYPLWVKISSYVVAGVFALPSIYFIHKEINELIDLFITLLKGKYGVFSNLIIKKVVHNSIYVIIVFFLSINILPLLIAELSAYGNVVLAVLLIVLGVCGYFLWNTVNKFHGMLDVMVRETILSKEAPENVDVIERAEKNNMVGEVKISDRSPFAGKTIVETDLRRVTGATILSIARGKKHIENPSPDTKIKTDDVLVLLGSKEAQENARKHLNG